MRRRGGSVVGSAAAAALVAFAGHPWTTTPVFAADTWDNTNGNANWSLDINWADDVKPTSADDVTFPAGFPNGDTLITFAFPENALSLTLNDSYAFTLGTLTIAGTGNVTVAATKSVTMGASISGSGGLTKLGSGTLIMSAGQNWTGGVAINAGTLSVDQTNRLGNAANNITFNGGQLATTGSFTMARNITLNAGGGQLAPAVGTSLSHAGAITGAGAMTYNGLGTVVLGASNGYTGATLLNSGVVEIFSSNNLGSPAGSILFNGGTLRTTAHATLTRSITLNAGGGTIDTNLQGVTLSGAVSGSGSITVAGGGFLRPAVNNLYSGATLITGGNLQLLHAGGVSGSSAVTVSAPYDFDVNGFASSVGSLSGSGDLLLGSGSLSMGSNNTSTTFSGSTSGTGSVTKNGSGTFTITGSFGHSGGTTINGGPLRIGDGGANGLVTGSITINSPGTLAFNRSDTVTHAGAISGNGAVSMTGSGTIVLSGSNTYTGPTNIDSGIVRLGSANGVASNSSVMVAAGATFDLNNLSKPIGSLGGAGDVVLGSATLTTGGNNAFITVHSGPISGTGSLTKAGTGTFALAGTNTYTGATNVGAGKVRIDNDASLPATTAVNVSGGATLDLNISSSTVGSLAGAGIVEFNGTASLNAGGNNSSTTFSGGLSGFGTLTKSGSGTFTSTGSHSLLMTTVNGVGGTFRQTGGTNSTDTLNVNNGTYDLQSGTLSTSVTRLGDSVSGNATFTQSGGDHNIGGVNGALIIGANTSSIGNYTITAGNLLPKSLYVGRNNLAVGTFTQSGGIVSLSTEFLDIGLNAGSTGTANLNAGSLTAKGIYVGGISSAAGGTGVLNIAGTSVTVNPFTSGFAVTRIWNTSGTALNLSSGSLSTGSLNTSGNPSRFVWTGGALTLGTDNSTSTFDGTGGGASASLTKTGTGTVDIKHARVGTLSVNAGTLIVQAGGGNAGTSVVNNFPTVAGAATFDLNESKLIVQFGTNPSPLVATRAAVVAGRGGTDFGNAPWNGTGGIASAAAAPGGIGDGTNPGDGISFAVGYVENSFLPSLGLPSYTSFGGQTVNSGSMLIRFTRGADANLDGRVNTDDVTILGALFNSAGTGEWFLGDFDFDGVCDSDDVTVLGALYDATAPALSTAQLSSQYGSEFAAAFDRGRVLGANVPEPGSLIVVGMGAIGAIGRRRRKSSERASS